MKHKLTAAVFFAAVTVLRFAASAGAVDGTIEINQAKVLAAGGFPYAISASGSYRLTGNLTVPANKDAIDVTAPIVTIDLNGFSIIGPDSSNNTTFGIKAPHNDVTAENGTVTGFGLGVYVGLFGIVRNVHADLNGSGINGMNNTVVEGCTANNSTSGDGISCPVGCVISGNTANANSNSGIHCDLGCLISGNTVFGTFNSFGIVASDATTGYGGNVLNNTNDVSKGTSLGHNLCSGTPC